MNSNEAKAAAEARVKGREVKVVQREVDRSELYPHNDRYQWGAWPVIAIETGGYSDLEAHNPSTGDYLWTRALRCDKHPDPADASWVECEACRNGTIYDALRRLVDAMEAHGFLDDPEELVTREPRPETA